MVAQVWDGASLDAALPAAQSYLSNPPDRALLQALSYGVLRDQRALEYLAGRLLQRPTTDSNLQAVLLVGLYQLRSMRIPPHAAVSETVAATRQLRLAQASGLVNAVLRRYQREQAGLEQALNAQPPAVRWSYPDWLASRFREDWPEHWPSLLEAGQTPGPMSLRVNRRRGTREDYQARLQSVGLASAPCAHAGDALTLAEAVGVERLPGFEAGDVSVQDESAQLAASLLELTTPDSHHNLRVLDACAAPGGKTAHILESATVELQALDCDESRLSRVEATLQRLGFQAECRVADAARPRDWWEGRLFDRILLDAPCSGTGVIRRHPDIKWLRREADIVATARKQRQLLSALWPLLAPGGVLLYATCSVLREEGEAVVADFLNEQRDAIHCPIKAQWGEDCTVGRRIASGESGMDGFYYARLRRP